MSTRPRTPAEMRRDAIKSRERGCIPVQREVRVVVSPSPFRDDFTLGHWSGVLAYPRAVISAWCHVLRHPYAKAEIQVRAVRRRPDDVGATP